MNNVKLFPAGLDHQGRNRTRDRAAESEWLDTVQVQRRLPLQRIDRKKSRAAQFCLLLALAVLVWALGYSGAVLIAAMVAA